MKKFIQALSLTVILGAAITLNSCKKENTTTADDSVSAQDNATITRADDATTDDAAAAAGQVASFAGKTESPWWNTAVLCGVTLVDSGTAGNRTITITYDGTTDCNGVIRSGTVTIVNNSGIPWNLNGSVLNITYNALAITDPVSGNTYTINGTRTLTKETNGLAWKVLAGLETNTTVTRRNQGNMSITFPGGGVRSWTVDRTRSWSSLVNGSVNTITVTVSTQADNNVDVTGTNRFGVTFTNSILTPIAANNNAACYWKPYQGQTTHAVANRSANVLYGTNPAGVQIGNATTCGDGYFITYTKANGTQATRFVSYW